MVASPYLAPGFYDKALAAGKHRDIVGGRWDETARAQIALLQDEGLRPEDRLLDIGCGCLRLGHKAAAYLAPGNYWGTDASLALMRRGYEVELTDETRARLPPGNLIEDPDFAFPGVPEDIDLALAFAVFTHLPPDALPRALASIRSRFPRLRRLLLTLFLVPEGHSGAHRQPDGVVTHPDRPPWHRTLADATNEARTAGFAVALRPHRLPRGQRLLALSPA